MTYNHLALDVHEDQAAREPDGDHHQFGPEWPLQLPGSNLLCCSENMSFVRSCGFSLSNAKGIKILYCLVLNNKFCNLQTIQIRERKNTKISTYNVLLVLRTFKYVLHFQPQ